jgi:hypothetical protein
LLARASLFLLVLVADFKTLSFANMPPKQTAAKVMVKTNKLTEGEKKKLKQENKAKANPEKSAAKLVKNDAKRAGRKESGSVKKLG